MNGNDRFFLDDREMRELTGYKTLKRQVEWLQAHNWVFVMAYDACNGGRSCKPKVARAYAAQKMGVRGVKVAILAEPEHEWQPDFTDLRNGTASV